MHTKKDNVYKIYSKNVFFVLILVLVSVIGGELEGNVFFLRPLYFLTKMLYLLLND